jgi:hypothetical protein
MKKIGVYIVLVFFASVYIISSNLELNKMFTQYRFSSKSIIGSDVGKYGDLYDGCYLHDYKKTSFMNGGLDLTSLNKPSNCLSPKKIDLFVMSDSYLHYLSDSMLCGINKLTHCYSERIKALDKNKINVLLIETVERLLRRDFCDTTKTFNKLRIGDDDIPVTTSGFSRFMSLIMEPASKPELEFNLFGYKPFTRIKEMKAQMNYELFNRINKEVTMSSDKKYLYLTETIDKTSKRSSFSPISTEEITKIVKTLNSIYKHYKALGFDEVYFSIMPNPVSVLNTESTTYNQLIPKVQYHNDLKMPIIDIYKVFLNTKVQVYYNSDTHWNIHGFQLWLDEFNKILTSIND